MKITESLKIVGIHHAASEKVQSDLNYNGAINKIKNSMKMLKMRTLSMCGKVTGVKQLIHGQDQFLLKLKNRRKLTARKLTQS